MCESIKNILKVKLFFFKLNHVNFIITIDSNRHSMKNSFKKSFILKINSVRNILKM